MQRVIIINESATLTGILRKTLNDMIKIGLLSPFRTQESNFYHVVQCFPPSFYKTSPFSSLLLNSFLVFTCLDGNVDENLLVHQLHLQLFSLHRSRQWFRHHRASLSCPVLHPNQVLTLLGIIL